MQGGIQFLKVIPKGNDRLFWNIRLGIQKGFGCYNVKQSVSALSVFSKSGHPLQQGTMPGRLQNILQ